MKIPPEGGGADQRGELDAIPPIRHDPTSRFWGEEMQLDMEAQIAVRVFRGMVMAATAFMLSYLQGYFTISYWQLALAFGMLGLMHSTERVARFGLTILIVLVLIPPSSAASAGRWLLAMRNGSP